MLHYPYEREVFKYKGLYPSHPTLQPNQHNPLSLTYIAAINLGESSNAPDVSDYKNPDGTLNREKFIADMKSIYSMGFTSQLQYGAEHLIWNPVGMGAFLRHLQANFPQSDVGQIRDELAAAMLDAYQEVKRETPCQLHLCLHTEGDESISNYNAFVKALETRPALHSSIEICENADMVDLAQCLADQLEPQTSEKEKLRLSGKVAVVVAANRKLLGNHYFEDGAAYASDEGIHRRSPSAAAVATYLNGATVTRGKFSFPPKRAPGELADRIAGTFVS